MNREIIKQRLILDEGIKNKVYKDHLGNLTVGIGHLILSKDGLFLNDYINDERINQLFDEDLDIHTDICYQIFTKPLFDSLPENTQHAIINLAFNLGINKLVKFKKFIKAIMNKQFDVAKEELKNSLWYTQIQKSRSKYIIDNIGV